MSFLQHTPQYMTKNNINSIALIYRNQGFHKDAVHTAYAWKTGNTTNEGVPWWHLQHGWQNSQQLACHV